MDLLVRVLLLIHDLLELLHAALVVEHVLVLLATLVPSMSVLGLCCAAVCLLRLGVG